MQLRVLWFPSRGTCTSGGAAGVPGGLGKDCGVVKLIKKNYDYYDKAKNKI